MLTWWAGLLVPALLAARGAAAGPPALEGPADVLGRLDVAGPSPVRGAEELGVVPFGEERRARRLALSDAGSAKSA